MCIFSTACCAMSAVAQPPPLAAPALRLARPLSSSSSDSARSDASPTLSSPSCSPPVQYKHLVGPPLRNYRSPPAADGADTEGESSNSSDLDLDSPQDRDEDRQLDSLRDEVDAESIIGPLISRTQSNALYASAHTPANISESDDDEPPPPLPPRLPGMLDVPPLPSRTGVLKKPPAASGGVRPLLEGPEAKPRVGFAEHKKTGTRRTRLPSFTLPNMSLPHLSLPSFASGGSGLSGGGKLHKKGHDRQRSKTLSLPRPSSIMFSGSAARAVTMFTGRTMEEPATQQEPPSQRMRRASSVSCLAGGNLPLSRSDSMVSVSSSINDDSKYLHIHSQTNSRFKAIKDNFVDALPQLPALQQQFASLNPFTDGSAAAPITPLKGSFRQSAALDAIDTVTGDVVVMGGYRGSILRDKTVNNRRVWIPLKVGFNLRKVDLEVGLEAEDEERMADRIHADGMLTHIGPVDISRRLIRKLRNTAEEHDRKVHDYGYDWRLSPDLLSRRLIAFLEKLPCNQVREGDPTTRRGALVIAHSLGGLIVRHAVNQRPELFSGVLFAGTPMHCVNILGPLRNGDSVLFNSKVFTAQVRSKNLPSSLQPTRPLMRARRSTSPSAPLSPSSRTMGTASSISVRGSRSRWTSSPPRCGRSTHCHRASPHGRSYPRRPSFHYPHRPASNHPYWAKRANTKTNISISISNRARRTSTSTQAH